MDFIPEMNVIWMGLFASLGAGLASGLGAGPAFIIKSISPKLMDALLGFSAGIMLAATSFSKAVNEYFLRYGYGGFPVLDDGKVFGIIPEGI